MHCTMRAFLFPFSFIVLLSACAPLAPSVRSEDTPWLKADAARPHSLADAGLSYYAHARGLNAAEWARENEALREAVARNPSDFLRLRQALLLLAPAAPAKEQARLGPLLERVERDTQKSPASLHALVQLLRGELEERRRLEDKLRDEGKKNEELEQKLEALKAIEKNLLDRRRTAPGVSK